MALTLFCQTSFNSSGEPQCSPRWAEPVELVYDISLGNIDPSKITITNTLSGTPTIAFEPLVIADPGTNGWRHFMVMFPTLARRKARFVVNRNTKDGKAEISSSWKPVITQDFDTWTQSNTISLVGGTSGTIEFDFADPFPEGDVYLSSNIVGRQSEADAFATTMLLDAACTPNASSDINGAYRVSQSVNNVHGSPIGGYNQYGLKLDWGGSTTDGSPKRHLIVMQGIHSAGEQQCWPAFVSFIDWVMNHVDAADLRSNWIMHVYFSVNANGLEAGQPRTTPDGGAIGISRAWTDPPAVPVVAETEDIQAAILADLAAMGATASFGFFWHGDVYTTNPYNIWVDDSELSTPRDSYLSIKSEFESLAGQSLHVSNASAFNDAWFAEAVLDCGGFAIENSACYTTDISHYNNLGVLWGQTLVNADATGVFNTDILPYNATALFSTFTGSFRGPL